MFIKTWGTRGSCATVKHNKLEYGGNTMCYQVITETADHIIIDAGTGIVELGSTLPETGTIHLFISHWHLDHVVGLGFFKPLFEKGRKVFLYLPQGQKNAIDLFFNGVFFPLKTAHLKCDLVIKELDAKTAINICGLTIESPLVPHTGVCHGFRITSPKGKATILSDVEVSIAKEENYNFIRSLVSSSVILFADTYFTEEEYKKSIGWGHTAMETWIDLVAGTDVQHLICTHHHIERTDEEIDFFYTELKPKAKEKNVFFTFAREGLRYSVEYPQKIFDFTPIVNTIEWNNALAQELLGYTDTYVILDRILLEARRITQAEAGTIYLAEGEDLIFAYTHNDVLFANHDDKKSNKLTYANTRLKINENSIAGYCAYTKKLLFLDDVRNIPEGYAFSFNDSFDKATNYFTVSMFCVPLLGHNNKLLGVIQLINRKELGESTAFPRSLTSIINLLALQAVNAIERGQLVQEMVSRMHNIIALNDPNETGGHVERVGAVSAELYEHIALKDDINLDESRAIQGQIRLAAMLHDIGKVGIPNEILKKPARLTEEEFAVMKTHAAIGGNLFDLTLETTDILAKNIAVHHHQKWNGTGYTGSPDIPILSGEDIPIEARIVAVADVFDALLSKRVYKPEWSWDDAMKILQADAGSHFDPKVVEAMCEIQDVVKAIYDKYSDN